MVRRPISVAMIVKDEGDHIGACLTSLAPIADEICVVDTGSSDNTPEIARQHGAKVSSFPWRRDFSAARNESLRYCTGDWIFVVDPDERIAQADLPKVRALAEGPMDRCYAFVARNYTNTLSVSEFHPCAPDDPHARGFAGWYPSVKVRFFPNHVGARFEGKVHELVNMSLESHGIQVEMCDVPIHHYPLARPPERIQAKRELYLQLGIEKIQAAPDDPNAYAELGNQHAELGEYAKAAAAYREAVKRDPSNADVLKDLGGVLHLLGRSNEAKKALRLCLERDPAMAEAWRNLGVIHTEEAQWALAVECFGQCLALDPAWSDGYGYLSVALEGAERFEEAAEAARKGLEANPSSPHALRRYVQMMISVERQAEAREFIQGLIDAGTRNPDLRDALRELEK